MASSEMSQLVDYLALLEQVVDYLYRSLSAQRDKADTDLGKLAEARTRALRIIDGRGHESEVQLMLYEKPREGEVREIGKYWQQRLFVELARKLAQLQRIDSVSWHEQTAHYRALMSLGSDRERLAAALGLSDKLDARWPQLRPRPVISSQIGLLDEVLHNAASDEHSLASTAGHRWTGMSGRTARRYGV